ncbi:ATP-binding protein [Siccibacter turicensis]|uniref:ATP-binding protein n=1 Tax=Siccibacter turicensis TaxID=357233 RepID=A0A2P8VLU7_9ENTR|nr:ATP-binding protein [Siccibacter turicensis]PSN08543.1 ATP-binding protein [Siccibacter turicensis]
MEDKSKLLNITKKTRRTHISRLKKLVSNSLNSASWEIVEHNRRKLRLGLSLKEKYNPRVKLKVSNKRVIFFAPEKIDYYQGKNYELTNKFLGEIHDCIKKGRRIFIDFRNTKKISAAAMLSFLAEVDVLIKKHKHGYRCINFSHPYNEKIESILIQVGFYELLRKQKRTTKEFEDVTFWKYTSGSCSEPILAKEMMGEIKKELAQRASKKLYRGFTEAMSNSVEHAYIDDKEHTETDDTAKWWTFAGIRDKQLIVVICDKGVGIPKTLPKTQGVSSLRALIANLGYSLDNVKDSIFIKASTEVQKTRTGERYRGKGLKDIKSVIDSIGTGYMSIFSNRGRYIYKGHSGNINEVTFDQKSSVRGTIIEWSIPCDVESSKDENDKSS